MNQVIQYREKPLNIKEFSDLESIFEKCFEIKQKYNAVKSPIKDAEGNIFRWEHDTIENGLELTVKNFNEKAFVSLVRPATKDAIIAHLTRLSVHKHYSSGNSAWGMFVKDISEMLFADNISEFAVLRICNNYIKDSTVKFFPQSAELMKKINDFDKALKNHNKPILVTHKEIVENTVKEINKEKIAGILHDGGLPHDQQYCQKCNTKDALDELLENNQK